VVVFVGTSFAVTLTSLAMDQVKARKLRCFNFNIDPEPERAAAPTLRWSDIVGPAEVTLPLLCGMAAGMVVAGLGE
jgi:hypothetical protein